MIVRLFYTALANGARASIGWLCLPRTSSAHELVSENISKVMCVDKCPHYMCAVFAVDRERGSLATRV